MQRMKLSKKQLKNDFIKVKDKNFIFKAFAECSTHCWNIGPLFKAHRIPGDGNE